MNDEQKVAVYDAIITQRISVHPRQDGSWIISDRHGVLTSGPTLHETIADLLDRQDRESIATSDEAERRNP